MLAVSPSPQVNVVLILFLQTAGRSRQVGEKSDRLIAHKAKSIMDLKQADFDIQVTLGRITQLEYDPADPILAEVPDAAKPIAGFLLGLVRLYMETENEHDKKTLQCVALYHLHIVFDGLVKNFRGKDARAKASEVLVCASAARSWGARVAGAWRRSC